MIEEQVVEMEMDDEATLDDLRSAIAKDKNIAPMRIRLIFKARILTKNEKLKDLNIQPSDSIIISIKKVFLFSS